jgi:hypothetical protein
MTTCGGSVNGALAVLRGDLAIAGGLCLGMVYPMVHGLGKFEGEAVPNDLRVLTTWLTQWNPVWARADCPADEGKGGMKYFRDKTELFAPSIPGGSCHTLYTVALDVLDYGEATFAGSYKDAVDALRDGRIEALAMSASSPQPPSTVMELEVTKPLKLISFSDDEVRKAMNEAPYVVFVDRPADYYEGREHPPVSELEVACAWVCSKDMTDDVAYELTKAYCEGWEEQIHQKYPNKSNVDPKDTPADVAKYKEVYVHAGALRYYEEVGVDIPEGVVPPEM